MAISVLFIYHIFIYFYLLPERTKKLLCSSEFQFIYLSKLLEILNCWTYFPFPDPEVSDVLSTSAVLFPKHLTLMSARTSQHTTRMMSDEIKCENLNPTETSSSHPISSGAFHTDACNRQAQKETHQCSQYEKIFSRSVISNNTVWFIQERSRISVRSVGRVLDLGIVSETTSTNTVEINCR